jgi:GNAT superfamily N-acetyltransferase
VFRSPVHVREAGPADADGLVEVWCSASRMPERGTAERESCAQQVTETSASVAAIAADPDQRLIVAEIEGQIVGAALLARAPLSPVHSESAIHVSHLHVLEAFRRHGVGHALMEATVTWAEEKDTSHVLAAASVGSRDANRFMARLGLGQIAVVRGAPVSTLRAKLPVEPPAAARVGTRSHRSVGQVLVARRSLRRSQSRLS